MFKHFTQTAFKFCHALPKNPISSSAALTVGVSTTFLFMTSSAVAGRNTKTIIRCDSGLDDDLSSDKKDFVKGFQRPRWIEDNYLSADKIFSSGPIWYPTKRAGIVRCDALIVNANSESEDSIAVYFPDTDDEDDRRSYLALFDGHNGPAMSDFLCDHLLEYVASAISKLPQQYELSGFLDMIDDGSDSSSTPADDVVSDTIKQAFKDVDDAMINVSEVLSSPSKTNAIRTLRHAYSGSCALMSIYETDTRLLRVALTGDSRAVLGRKTRSKDGDRDIYEVHLLTHDQNAHNPKEVARLEAEHPGEQVVKNGRVMGWGMARAFGDAAYKWSLEIQEQLNEKYLGDAVRSNIKTPPYLTAEPEITSTRIQKGDFLIMASDGLWDCLTSDEAVGLVGLWLANNTDSVYTDTPVKDFAKKRFKDEKVYTRDELPLTVPLKKDNDENDKTPYYPWWRTAKRFVNKDSSVAAHLTRNALGGADSDLTEALISLTHPRARRDDVGVIVAFF